MTETMPAAIWCEKTILGVILQNSNQFAAVRERLSAHDFSLDSNRVIFQRMEDLAAKDQEFDVETVQVELDRRGELPAVGGRAYLWSLNEGLPYNTAIEEHMNIVKDKAVLRNLIAICAQAGARAAEQSESGLEIAAWTDSAIETLVETGMGVTEASAGVAGATVEALADFHRRRSLEKDDTIPYGMMPDLDAVTGGMFPGEMTVIGGESGVGKSSAMIQALVWAGRRDIPAVCYSLEMPRKQVLGRIWSIIAKVPYRFVRFPRMANQQQALDIQSAAYQVAEWPLHFYDRTAMTISEICASAKVHIQRRGARLICVDYLQRIVVPGQKEIRLQTAQAAMKLSLVVRNTPAHMMLLSQLKRREDNGFPQMKDLRESGQIENEAHVIALLWREYDKEKGHHLTDGKVLIPKNRFGFSGMVNTIFNTDYAVFE